MFSTPKRRISTFQFSVLDLMHSVKEEAKEYLNLWLKLLLQGLQLLHVCFLHGPTHTETLFLVGFRDLLRVRRAKENWTFI